jgi:hypothetical protein
MSPNGEVVVVASKSSLAFYSAQTGECDTVIDNIYSGETSSNFLIHQFSGFLMTLFISVNSKMIVSKEFQTMLKILSMAFQSTT